MGTFGLVKKKTLPTAIPKSCDTRVVLISHIVGPESPSGHLPGSLWHLPTLTVQGMRGVGDREEGGVKDGSQVSTSDIMVP